MIDTIFAVKQFFGSSGDKIDNIFFRILTKYSTVVFGVCFLVNVVCFYFIEPISCISDVQVENVIDTYCWIKAMYTLKANDKDQADLFAHPGVKQQFSNEEFIFHRFYQFIYIVLFLQAIAAYVPRYLWKSIEREKVTSVANVIAKLNPLSLLYDEPGEEKNRKDLAIFLHERLHCNKTYAAKYFMCEFLAICNVFLQTYLTDVFVGGNFLTYGIKVFSLSPQESFTNPRDASFPKVTKCTFKMYGPSGNIIPYDALCVLPINIANEKIYLVLWLWLAFLFCVSALAILYRSVLVCSSKLRIWVLNKKIHSKMLDTKQFRILAKQIRFCDWFYLNLIKENTPEKMFTDIIRELYLYEIKSRQKDITNDMRQESIECNKKT